MAFYDETVETSTSARSAESDLRLGRLGPEAPEADLDDAPFAVALRRGVPGHAMRL